MNAHAETALLSVVVPTHNVHPWIRETLGSVLAQDVDGMEVIVVDDHSTDDTVDVVRAIAARDPRVKLVQSTSRGGGTARNTGVQHALGRYLVFCDGDDLVPDGAYRALVESLEASGSEVAFGDFLKFSPIHTWRPTENWPVYGSRRQRFVATAEPSIIYGRAVWNKAFRRSFWLSLDVAFPDVPRSNDIVPMTAAYLRATSIDMVDDIVYLYRERQGASSMSANADSATSFLSYLTQELECAELIARKADERLSSAYAALIFDRDGWVHLAQYLRSGARDVDRDEEVRAALERLVQATGRSIDHVAMPHKRLVFRLTLNGATEAAAALARLTSGSRPEVPVELENWLLFLRLRSDAGDHVLRDEPWLSRLIAESLATAILAGSSATDPQLVDLAARAAAEDPAVLEDAPELFGLAELDLAALASRLHLSRSPAASISEISSGTRLDLAVQLPLQGSATAVLFDPRSGSVFRPGQVDDVGDGIWRVGFSASALPLNRRLIVAALDHASGRLHLVRFSRDVPAYSPFDRFALVRRRDTLEVTRRGHWTTRAARKGARLVRQRASSVSKSD